MFRITHGWESGIIILFLVRLYIIYFRLLWPCPLPNVHVGPVVAACIVRHVADEERYLTHKCFLVSRHQDKP